MFSSIGPLNKVEPTVKLRLEGYLSGGPEAQILTPNVGLFVCLFVCYLLFISRCMGPEGPWQRLCRPNVCVCVIIYILLHTDPTGPWRQLALKLLHDRFLSPRKAMR